MQTFTQSLIALLDRGIINYQDATQVAERKTELRLAKEQRRVAGNPAREAPRAGKPEGDLLDLL